MSSFKQGLEKDSVIKLLVKHRFVKIDQPDFGWSGKYDVERLTDYFLKNQDVFSSLRDVENRVNLVKRLSDTVGKHDKWGNRLADPFNQYMKIGKKLTEINASKDIRKKFLDENFLKFSERNYPEWKEIIYEINRFRFDQKNAAATKFIGILSSEQVLDAIRLISSGSVGSFVIRQYLGALWNFYTSRKPLNALLSDKFVMTIRKSDNAEALGILFAMKKDTKSLLEILKRDISPQDTAVELMNKFPRYFTFVDGKKIKENYEKGTEFKNVERSSTIKERMEMIKDEVIKARVLEFSSFISYFGIKNGIKLIDVLEKIGDEDPENFTKFLSKRVESAFYGLGVANANLALNILCSTKSLVPSVKTLVKNPGDFLFLILREPDIVDKLSSNTKISTLTIDDLHRSGETKKVAGSHYVIAGKQSHVIKGEPEIELSDDLSGRKRV